ncbi:MAG: sporulation peptidase YabG [Massilibacillus sp.]|nr:sporulation peptidase YabG [Massilibacillus sp.]
MVAIGDLVVRKSHGKDIIFKVIDIDKRDMGLNRCVLKGMHLRLVADAPVTDLEAITAECLRNEVIKLERVQRSGLDRAFDRRKGERRQKDLLRGDLSKKYSFFDVPGRVLHIDGDEEYLKMCLKTYSQLNIEAVGRCIDEVKQPIFVTGLVEQYHPDILVLTGHDALIGGKKDFNDINNYRHSKYFVESVKKVRAIQPSRDELVIFAGACQSYFEAILSAGANFASAPTRIFIHAYDPVFIAEKVAFTPINRTVDVSDAIAASVTGIEGVGGVETRGKFRLGLPKTPYGY